MDYNSATKQRFKEMRPGADGKLIADWQLTDTKLLDAVKLTLPPAHAIPIIFVPGIMGSNLADNSDTPIWLLNSVGSVPVGLAWNWSPRSAGERQSILHPLRTKVYRLGSVPKDDVVLGLRKQDFLDRGWGEVSEASYQKFLIWLHLKMNASRDPLTWSDFSSPTEGKNDATAHLKRTLKPGILMSMLGLPVFSEAGSRVEPINSDDLLKRSKSSYPIYAFGYNWLDNNNKAADLLRRRIQVIIKENNKGTVKCTQVILITHSMGGLVARACAQLPEMSQKILGIVHGVMPATGAAVAYRRCKIGMREENIAAGLVIGSDGKEVTAVFAQSPGALQLLPSEDYGVNWLQITDSGGRIISQFPKVDPYEEIYLQMDRWWSLIREDWLSPAGGNPIKWAEFVKNILSAKDFHRELAGKYHHNTFSFYGGGTEKQSFGKIIWTMRKGTFVEGDVKPPSSDAVVHLRPLDVRTDGSNNLYVGGRRTISTSARGDASTAYYRESSFWEIRCSSWTSAGDGTVPDLSGKAPRIAGGKNILQQFELSGVEHEPAYRDYPVAQIVAYYAITKISALASRS